MNDSFERRVRDAEGRKKIFDNRVKYILFYLTVFGAFLTMWDKCAHLFQTTPPDHAPMQSVDTPAMAIKPPRNRRPRSGVTRATASTPSHTPRQIAPARPWQAAPQAPPQGPPQASLETLYADNIEFTLLSAIGSVGAQTIKMTVVLKTNAANWEINERVQSIIDNEGNEYRAISFMNGAASWNHFVQLTTGVPIKCTYTFGGVLPQVKTIKLFKYQYFAHSYRLSQVEFRDIPITWR